ncbi:MAG: phage holin family protein [Desulfobacteraceae bacterium]|nr:phage holin family protein [Desulfobacteraceae bacterium]MCB9494858.1 phage holin family protein [Desulfobacteraceae bacterium]
MDKNYFWFKVLVQTIAILVTAAFFDGIIVENVISAFFAAIILGFLNAVLRPLLIFLTLPITLFSLGFFIFIINAVILKLTAFFIPGFIVSGFFTSIFGALFISIVSFLLNILTFKDNSIEVIDLKKRNGNFWE